MQAKFENAIILGKKKFKMWFIKIEKNCLKYDQNKKERRHQINGVDIQVILDSRENSHHLHG
jgi:hypothetical protein